MTNEADVAQALLGTWPTQVAAWGKSGIAAYLAELGARGVTPAAAVLAIRSFDPDADFPPSAAKLASVARRDPSRPTGLEIVDVLWGPGGVMHARSEYPNGGFRGPSGREDADDTARMDAAVAKGPLVTAFLGSVGLAAVKAQDPIDAELTEGEASMRRNWLAKQWEAFQDRKGERDVAELIAARHLDPLGALKRAQAQADTRVLDA